MGKWEVRQDPSPRAQTLPVCQQDAMAGQRCLRKWQIGKFQSPEPPQQRWAGQSGNLPAWISAQGADTKWSRWYQHRPAAQTGFCVLHLTSHAALPSPPAFQTLPSEGLDPMQNITTLFVSSKQAVQAAETVPWRDRHRDALTTGLILQRILDFGKQ